MPYIKEVDKEKFEDALKSIIDNIVTPGEFNYVISMICKELLVIEGESYSNYNDLIGILECAKLELYRRMVAPYEDKKIIENGDVY